MSEQGACARLAVCMHVRVERRADEWILHIRGISRTMANTFRRCILRDVPTLAATKVSIRANTSNFWDEYVAHRIALLPFKGKPDVMTMNFTGTSQHPEPVLSSALVGENAKAAIPDIPLVLLMDGQALHINVTVGYGSGRQHARFAPGVCFFNESDDDIVLHLEPRDGVCGRTVLTQGIQCVRKAIESMANYTTVAHTETA